MHFRIIAVLIFLTASFAYAELYRDWDIRKIQVKKNTFYCGKSTNQKIKIFTKKDKKFISFNHRISNLKKSQTSELKILKSNKKRFTNICFHFWRQIEENSTGALTPTPNITSTIPLSPTLALTATSTNTATPTPAITLTPTATTTPSVTSTITATPSPTSKPSEIEIPDCPQSGALNLSDTRMYVVNENIERDCPVNIPEGVKIKILDNNQITFKQIVSIAPPTSGVPKKIFYAPWAESNIKVKWWLTPVVFLKRQVLYPEWFGASLCTRNEPCTNASIPFQLGVNSLNAGKPITVEEIATQNLPLDDNIGGSILAYQFYAPPTKYYRIDSDVINTRHHITIDLRNNFIHREGESGFRFICNGDRNRSTDNIDESGRTDGFLQSRFSTETDRWNNALFGCTIKRVKFGIPREENGSPEDSLNMTGIANLLWVRGGLIEDVDRYGRGTTGISFNLTRDSTINRVRIFGSRDSYFSYNHSTRTYRWENRQIGILVHLSKNTKVINSKIVRGAYFAGIQVKGGEDNEIESNEIIEMRDPIEKLRIATPIGTVTPGINLEPIPFVNNTPLAYDNAPASLTYGSRNAFWDRGDSPYVTPAANPTLLPKYSYPYEGKGFHEADERRASNRTVWRDLSVKDSPNYNAFSNTESEFSTYDNISAENISSGFVFTRSQNGNERGHIVQNFKIEKVKIQGLIAQVEATPVPTGSPNPATPTPTINYSNLIHVNSGTDNLISNPQITPIPGKPTPYCFKPGSNSPSSNLLSGRENINCEGF